MDDWDSNSALAVGVVHVSPVGCGSGLTAVLMDQHGSAIAAEPPGKAPGSGFRMTVMEARRAKRGGSLTASSHICTLLQEMPYPRYRGTLVTGHCGC